MSESTSRPADPISGAQLVRATNAFTDEHAVKSWLLSLLTASLLSTALGGAIAAPMLAIALPCSLLASLLMVRMFVIYHDYLHGAILRHSLLATIGMWFFGIFALTPPSVWSDTHNHHHRNNCKLHALPIGTFPIMTTAEWQEASFLCRLRYRIHRHPITMLLAYPLVFCWTLCLLPVLQKPQRHWDGLIALALHCGIAWLLLTWGGWQALVLAQTLPYALACAFGAYLFYAQHNFPTVQFFTGTEWNYTNAALKSSSQMRMGPVLNWFTANIGYHHVHHLNGRIPFYRLPEAIRAMPELQNPPNTSFRPQEIWRCLHLALWDETSNTMVPYPPG